MDHHQSLVVLKRFHLEPEKGRECPQDTFPPLLNVSTFLAPAHIITVSVCCARKTCSKLNYTEKNKKKGRHLLPNKQDPMVFTLLSTPYLLWCFRFSSKKKTAFPAASSICFITSSVAGRNVTAAPRSSTCPGQTGRRGGKSMKKEEVFPCFSWLPQDQTHLFFL